MRETKREVFAFESIQDIEFEETPLGIHWLSFAANGCHYDMPVTQDNEKEYSVYHREALDADNCVFCSNKHSKCEDLTKKSEELFDYLIEHPSIRLKWVMRNQQSIR